MTTQFRKLILASTIALAIGGLSGTVAAEPLSQDIKDARQETQIWTTYALSPYLRALDLKVSVHNGKAKLSGTVDEDVNKDLAREIALGVDGITEVDNQITVKADYVPPKHAGERSFGDVIDDATITAAIKSKLLWNKHTSGMTTEVDTKMGKVTLQGTADTAVSRELAGRLAMNTHGVVSVDNQLAVGESKPGLGDSVSKSANEMESELSDTWVTTKVKSTLMYSSNVDGSAIDVSTSNGVVTLKGKVGSGAERALAIELAENVRGVKSVESKGLGS